MSYPAIAVIYNPNSTNSAQEIAQEFMEQLRQHLPKQKIILLETKKAGHGEQLSYEFALKYDTPLIISASGDGGYNDVVNGIMKARREGFMAVAGLLPAGNANDHYHNVHSEAIITQIVNATTTAIDLLKITATADNKPVERYAHSYIGFGLTPTVGKELNKNNLNILKEIFIVGASFFSHAPIPLKIDNNTEYYESIVCSNIDTMSKYLKISRPSSVSDGKFEVTIFKKRPKLRLLGVLFKTTMGTIEEDNKTDEFTCQTIQKTLVQADGEVLTLDANCVVKIVAEQQVLDCVV